MLVSLIMLLRKHLAIIVPTTLTSNDASLYITYIIVNDFCTCFMNFETIGLVSLIVMLSVSTIFPTFFT